MATREISSEIANDGNKLRAKASEEFGHKFSCAEIDVWTNYDVDEVPKHDKDRVVVFKPQPPEDSNRIGCIRVRDKDNIEKVVWDIVGGEGTYMGLVPAGCPFEAMLVVVKLITPK